MMATHGGSTRQISVQRPEFSFDTTPDFAEIKQSLISNGVALIRSFLPEDHVEALRKDVSDLAYRKHKHQLQSGDSALGRYSIQELKELEKFSTLKFAEDDFLKNLSDDFFYPYNSNFHKLYCHHDVGAMEFNNAWHFDRGLTLKFFLYLNDVGKENGAFWYDLGSHRQNAVKQHLCWEANMPILNYVPEDEVTCPIPMEGPSGTLIIFDASGYHQAGEITNGGDRWVARFHVAAGKRADGETEHRNPYARRNWQYRSGVYTTRENEKSAPWEPLPENNNKAKSGSPKSGNDEANGSSARAQPTSGATTENISKPVTAHASSSSRNGILGRLKEALKG